jgi:hypothetical protein
MTRANEDTKVWEDSTEPDTGWGDLKVKLNAYMTECPYVENKPMHTHICGIPFILRSI